jgi:flavin-dependent dehydrogenase
LSSIQVIGAGPAGSSAAIAALLHGGQVDLIEKSKFPRHKVCGEFLSPEIAPILDRLGVWNEFQSRGPFRVHRMELYLGTKPKIARLPEPAFGLSRYQYDHLLYRRALELGANPAVEPPSSATAYIQAYIQTAGRRTHGAEVRGNRRFGFKAHFTGPSYDAVELYFFKGCYVGINCVEDGTTNVCGLGPESILKQFNFEIDDLIGVSPALKARLQPLQRSMKWLNVGPLIFQNNLKDQPDPGTYPAGDALSFVDPFTGSGLLSAAITGELAGTFAAQGRSPAEYLKQCRRALGRPFEFSSVFRAIAGTQCADYLAQLIPGQWLYSLTRPRSSS